MKVALVGMPNCGKTSLFNALTGSNQKVGNYPGVTVERKEGSATDRLSGTKLTILDLPGIYSLNSKVPDEVITRDVVLGNHPTESKVDWLGVVLDASRLQQNLRLLIELKDLGLPCVAILNMADLAEKSGWKIDPSALSKELGGLPVVLTVATTGQGIEEVLAEFAKPAPPLPNLARFQPSEDLRKLYKKSDEILSRIAKRVAAESQEPNRISDAIDRWVLHPVLGSLLLLVVLILVFQAVFNWAQLPQDGIRWGISELSRWMNQVLPDGPLRSLLIDGVVAGVGSVVVFLPQILLLFTFILFLEDSGYMARAAFLMDRLMGRVGLHGRAFIPLLSSFACAIPGIMATRTIENPKDRLTTILIAPLMTCSARLPVYSLLIGAFIPNRQVLGILRLQGLVLIGLYLAGIFAALAVALVMRRTILAGPKPIFLMELPIYRWPSVRGVVMGLLERSKLFLRRAGTVILTISILIWFLVSYPGSSIETSYAGTISRFFEPLVQPLGFNWKIVMALIPGFLAREVMVGALATVYAVGARGAAVAAGDSSGTFESLQQILSTQWSVPTGLSLIVWYILACQCMSTLAVTKRETNSWRWSAFMLGYMTVLAYVGSFITYQIACRI